MCFSAAIVPFQGCTADLKQLYRMVQEEGLPEKKRKLIRIQKEKILASRGAESVFTVFMAIDEDPEVFRRISHGHFFYTSSRKGLFHSASTPLSIEERVRSSEGAIVGWSFEKPIPIKAGMLSMKNSVLTSLPHVF